MNALRKLAKVFNEISAEINQFHLCLTTDIFPVQVLVYM
jgi:hypothetical protein